MKKTILRSYASLIASVGVNVQKGQDVFVTAGLEQPEFTQMVVEACYKLGAARVVVDWPQGHRSEQVAEGEPDALSADQGLYR